MKRSIIKDSFGFDLAEAYPDRLFVQPPVAQIPWCQNVRILDQVKDPDQPLPLTPCSDGAGKVVVKVP